MPDILRPSVQEGSDATWQYAAGRRSVYNLRSTSDESIVIPSEQDLVLGTIIRYDPPQPLIVHGTRPDEQRTLSIAVEVSYPDDPATVAHSGLFSVITRTWGAIGSPCRPEPIRPRQYHGDVGPAGFKGSEYWFFANGLGPLAVIDEQHISALVLYKKDTKYGKVLQSEAK